MSPHIEAKQPHQRIQRYPQIANGTEVVVGTIQMQHIGPERQPALE
jgi:hypothetical protein